MALCFTSRYNGTLQYDEIFKENLVFCFPVLEPSPLGQDSIKGCLTIEVIEATLCMTKTS